MAPSPIPQRPLPSTRSRSSTSRPRGRPRTDSRASTANSTPGPPLKKRRYIPGGPGGGGRYIDVDGSETPVAGLGQSPHAQTAPRGRSGRDRTASSAPKVPQTFPRRQRERPVSTPRYSSAAAAAAAVVSAGDGYKPREERGWEEFHPHLDIDSRIFVYAALDVDGVPPALTNGIDTTSQTPSKDTSNPVSQPRTPVNDGQSPRTPSIISNGLGEPHTNGLANGAMSAGTGSPSMLTPLKRRPGRPRRHPDPNFGLFTPRSIPPPATNPKEKLTLPKPSFRKHDPFLVFDQNFGAYVDKPMANVGYQESDIFIRPDPTLIRATEGAIEEDLDLGPSSRPDGDLNAALGTTGVGQVEYDMDEQDDQWLAAYNKLRKEQSVEPITKEIFEITITKIEKEWHALEKKIPKPNPKPPQTHRPRSSSAAAVNGEPAGAAGEEQDTKCAICDDGDCENTNAIVFCDGCDLAVHQECYGVPFIPEGQWLCRKCQLIGRGTPTCIFCPNIDGAFKQTNSSRWAHLLCAIWIPEVNLGNTTFMEPVMDVERVPKPRWKLACYICRQKMGACIQCSNKNCFIAFHVTCARRARLFLKMKSSSGGPASIEPSQLKALCDKHVPTDWRREHDVDSAIVEAQDFYRRTMRGRLWADSQASALALSTGHIQAALAQDLNKTNSVPRLSLILGSDASTKDAKRKGSNAQKPTWRLPSGAPIIPQVVYNCVETSLQRFTILKRKEFVAEACKFWTLKREARRGAALIKRLQLQMENFSSMEITRRNFAGMGAVGRIRLQRRIDFGTKLQKDVGKLRELCQEIISREADRVKSAEMLVQSVDTVYFPIVPLLWDIFERVRSLDGKHVFHEGLDKIRKNLAARAYTSVFPFSQDLGSSFSAVIGLEPSETLVDATEALQQDMLALQSPEKEPASKLVGKNESVDLEAHPALKSIVEFQATTPYQKEIKKLAKRIIRSIEPLLEDATKKELQLSGSHSEKETHALELLFHNQKHSEHSMNDDQSEDVMEGVVYSSVQNGTGLSNGIKPSSSTLPSTKPPNKTPLEALNGVSPHNLDQAIRSTIATAGLGGVPWYMSEFDPDGTTIFEERWTGPEVRRGMSEELSSMDEEEVRGLVGGKELVENVEEEVEVEPVAQPIKPPVVATAAKKRPKRRRW